MPLITPETVATTTPTHGLTREAWNEEFAQRLMKMAGMTPQGALAYADSYDAWFEDGDDPVEAADEEMSCWDWERE